MKAKFVYSASVALLSFCLFGSSPAIAQSPRECMRAKSEEFVGHVHRTVGIQSVGQLESVAHWVRLSCRVSRELVSDNEALEIVRTAAVQLAGPLVATPRTLSSTDALANVSKRIRAQFGDVTLGPLEDGRVSGASSDRVSSLELEGRVTLSNGYSCRINSRVSIGVPEGKKGECETLFACSEGWNFVRGRFEGSCDQL